MIPTGPGLAPLFLSGLVVVALLSLGGLLANVLSTRAKLRLKEEELAATREQLQEQSAARERLESEIEHLEGLPKAGSLPMLQLAHEQRSPLAAIQNALDMVLGGYAVDDPGLQSEMLTLARDRAAATLARVNDFLRLGSIQHAGPERKAHSVQLLDVLRRLAPEKRIEARWRAVNLHIDVPDSLPLVPGTYEDMESLLSNLISNAIKYTRPGGTVTVTLERRDGGVLGSVKDTGIGISPEDLPRIFDQFYRAGRAKGMAPGTGLGLSIVKKVVDRYGGQIDVDSEVGKGSEFTFTFPGEMPTEEEDESRTLHHL
jgi:two-component system phosphate regulon sensor histidine kinase PhoR